MTIGEYLKQLFKKKDKKPIETENLEDLQVIDEPIIPIQDKKE